VHSVLFHKVLTVKYVIKFDFSRLKNVSTKVVFFRLHCSTFSYKVWHNRSRSTLWHRL
jgi:hypothetical protein